MAEKKGFWDSVQPAVKKETKKVLIYCVIGTALMCLAFLGLHMAFPEKIPFDYTVVLGGAGGCVMAVLNFFLMGLTVQNIADMKDEDEARKRMRASFSQRKLMQGLWIIAAILAPCFHPVAGLIPLFFPGVGIKFAGTLKLS